MKVLLGPLNNAGMPETMTRGLKAVGVDATCLQYTRGSGNRYGFGADISVDLMGQNQTDVMLGSMRNCIAAGFDLFHFWNRSFVFGPNYSGLTGIDIPLIRRHGGRIMYRFTGMDLRDYARDLDENPYSPFRYGYTAPPADVEYRRKRYIEMLAVHVDRFVVQDPEMAAYCPEAAVIPRAIDLDDWPFVGLAERKRPLVVHSPTDPTIKGTRFVIDAIEKLQQRGFGFDFKLITGMPRVEAKDWYQQADIIIDQLHIGAYGVLTVEAMALGKPVICYVRNDLFEPVYGELPVMNANPDTIEDVLAQLLDDSSLREELSVRGRAFVETHHDLSRVARAQADLYAATVESPQSPAEGLRDLDFFRAQLAELQAELASERREASAAKARADRLQTELADVLGLGTSAAETAD